MSSHPFVSPRSASKRSVFSQETADTELIRLGLITGGLAFAGYAFRSRGLSRFLFAGLSLELVRRGLQSQRQNMLTVPGVSGGPHGPVSAHAAITVRGNRDEVYRFWRDVTKAPQFMPMVEEVRAIDERVSVWKFRLAGGPLIEYTSEVQQDVPGRIIAWEIIGSQLFRGTGQVRFEDGPVEGSVVIQLYQWIYPALSLARFAGSAALRHQARQSLRNFKQLFETGEVARTDGQPSGRRTTFTSLSHNLMRPAIRPGRETVARDAAARTTAAG